MSESKSPKAGGLWGRLFGLSEDTEVIERNDQAAKETPPEEQVAAPTAPLPTEGPAPTNGALAPQSVSEVQPNEATADVTREGPEAADAIAEVVETEAPALPTTCSACGAVRTAGQAYCGDCGWMFPSGATAEPARGLEMAEGESDMSASSTPLRNRFELGGLIEGRHGVRRHRGIDLNSGETVVILAAAVTPEVSLTDTATLPVLSDEEIMPGFDDEIIVATPILDDAGAWPSVTWEKSVLEKANHPALPRVLDSFREAKTEYLVLEAPTGTSLWDAWDDPDLDANVRYGWLQTVAEALEALHTNGAIFEGISPDVIIIAEDGKPRITDVRDLLPMSMPANPPIRATLYTAPELILSPTSADARSDLYSFGALLYSLEYLHHPLEEKDFESPYTPKQITDRFPDVHPLFLRLINKTFTREPAARFPTDEMTKTDATGFKELIKTLDTCRRTFDKVRLDIAAWTTTGMVRTGNEDALTVLHGVDARLDDLQEYAMILLCDGMGGYEAGEVAADIAISEMRKYLLQQPIFAALTGNAGPKEGVDPKKYQEVLKEALRLANRVIYSASRVPGKPKRMMGCTAECVYVDSRHVISGHVGDSRVYHLHRGRLVQLTRDQTLVSRLVELGQLTPEEAEDHPRKNELQQAIGGQPDVMPGLYHGKLHRGDWVVICSDGLTNHISNRELETMLTREAANSAEEAARRLLNLVNLRGATDNATVVMVRAS